MRLILAISILAAALVSPQQAVASAPAPTTSISPLGFLGAAARKTLRRSELKGSAPRAVIRGQQIPVRGVLKPRRRHVQVTLQRREGPKWTTVNSGRTDKRSHFTITDRPLSGTSAVYRLTSTEATSPSPPIRVRLRSGSVAVPRRGTELLKPRDVVRITPAGVNQAVTFANRRAIPSVGSTIVVPPVPGAPEGWIGIVKASAKSQGKGVVIARDATLDDAYSDLTIAFTARGAASTAQSTGSTLSRRGAPEVLCTIGGKPPRFDIRPRLDDWDIDLVLDRRSRTVRQSLSADVTVVTTMETAAGIECSVTLPLVEKPIYSIGYVPIIASVGPTANISATSGFSASGEVKLRLRETTTAQANRSTMTTSVTASSNRQSFTSRASQTVSIGAGLQGSISVAKLVAFNLSLTGKVAADIQHGKQPDPCFVTSLMGNAETNFDGKSWGFLGWKFAVSDHDFGRRPLGNGCKDGPGTSPGGPGGPPTPTSSPTTPPGGPPDAPGAIQRVNTDAGGKEADYASGNGESWSPDGTRILFSSWAENLVPGDTNKVGDWFVKTIATGAIQRVNTDATGAQADGHSCTRAECAVWSPDGRAVLFASQANNLVPDDANDDAVDLFVKTLDTGAIQRVNTNVAGEEAPPGTDSSGQWGPAEVAISFSPDGGQVLFPSNADNLVPGDTNNDYDLFVKSLASGSIRRISTDAAGGQANDYTFTGSWSPDSKKVLFVSLASNLVPGDTNKDWDLFVKTLSTGAIERVGTDLSGGQLPYGAGGGVWSPDGTRVLYAAYADLFVKELSTGATQRVDTDADGIPADRNSYLVEDGWSPDGTRILFESVAANLVPDDTNDGIDLFVKDLYTGAIRRVNTDAAGQQEDIPNPGSNAPFGEHWSPDGQKVLFATVSSNLVPGDTNRHIDLFVKTLATAAIQRISTNAEGLQADDGSGEGFWSPDGRRVLFQSVADNLVPNDHNGQGDLFVKTLP